MRQDLTDITMVIDRSGSMASCVTEANQGIASFLRVQKVGVGSANLSVCMFNSASVVLHNAVPINSIESIQINCKGGKC